MGSVGATFIVIGIGLLYAMTGSLNMVDLAQLLPGVWDSNTVKVAYGFLAVGFCLKLALFPLHLWLPNAYTFAPSAVTAFMASTATKVAVYMLLRFFLSIFGAPFSFGVMALDRVLLPLALVAIVSMSLVAVFQVNAKRLLAYSSVAQIGYMILGLSFATATGLTATVLHLFNHALMKGCALHGARVRDVPGGIGAHQCAGGVGPADALDDGSLRGGRTEPCGRAADGGIP